MARKPFKGSVANNVLEHGTGGINIDECRVGINPDVDDKRLGGRGEWKTDKTAKNVYEGGYEGKNISSSEQGRFPANLMHDGSQVVEGIFPETNRYFFRRQACNMKHSQTCLQQSSSPSLQECGWTTAMKQKDPMPRPEIMQAMSAVI
jgi:hypothetical protein